MSIRAYAAALGLALGLGTAGAEQLPSLFGEHDKALRLSAAEDGRLAAEGDVIKTAPLPPGRGEKSPGKAFVLSALIPGAGELYAGSKVRAAIFFALEVAGVGLYFNWDGKGKDIEDEFRLRADSLWVPNDYLQWRNSTISRNSSITHALPCSTQIVDNIDATSIPERLGGCHGSEVQQYYELIGKYDQFIAGWRDAEDVQTGNRPLPTQIDSVEKFQSQQRLDYEIRRDDSNRYLKRASVVGGLILVNHVISAIDAARVARARSEGADEARLEKRTRFVFTMYPGGRGKVPMLTAYKPFR